MAMYVKNKIYTNLFLNKKSFIFIYYATIIMSIVVLYKINFCDIILLLSFFLDFNRFFTFIDPHILCLLYYYIIFYFVNTISHSYVFIHTMIVIKIFYKIYVKYYYFQLSILRKKIFN